MQFTILFGSPRPRGNTAALVAPFLDECARLGAETEQIGLYGRELRPCLGCMACQEEPDGPGCVQRDDFPEIFGKMAASDLVVFATPIYYYGMCGQMKTLLDRANPLFTADYAFRDIYLLAAAAEDDNHTVDGAVTGLCGWVDCFEKARLAGTVFAGGVTSVGEIQGHPALKKAYEMGRNV